MSNPIVIGFYGYSNSGKTTLIDQLIRELNRRGKRVAAIKQSGHPVSMDSDGKDTYHFTLAGADPVVLSSTIETTIKISKSIETSEIVSLIIAINQPEIIIIESAHDSEIIKIRIGDIELRENTIWTYDGNFEILVEKILNGGN